MLFNSGQLESAVEPGSDAEKLTKYAHHPDAHIWTATIDEAIDEQGYILPGLGDVGDRMYGTR
jgi:uracil phosphoribosyltransferase